MNKKKIIVLASIIVLLAISLIPFPFFDGKSLLGLIFYLLASFVYVIPLLSVEWTIGIYVTLFLILTALTFIHLLKTKENNNQKAKIRFWIIDVILYGALIALLICVLVNALY